MPYRRSTVSLLCLLLSVSGCSDDSAETPGAAGGTSASGSSAKLADLGIEVPASVASACLQYAQFVCAAIARCAPSNFAESFLDQADCERIQQDDCRPYALPGVLLDASKLPSCFAGLAQVACEREVITAVVKEAETCAGLNAPGSLPDGAPCFIAAQCSGKACVKPKELANKIENSATEINSLRVCGVCASGNLAGKQGEPCGDPTLTPFACEDGLQCRKDNTCQPDAPVGAACGFVEGTDDNIHCDAQGFCDNAVGQCTPRLAEGVTCKYDSDCAEGLFCKAGGCAKTLGDGESGCAQDFHCGPNGIFGLEIRCVEGTCRREPVLQEGAPCGGSIDGDCVAGTYCGQEKPYSCIREPGAGEPCRLCSDPLRPACCGPGLFCENGVCVGNKATACGG